MHPSKQFIGTPPSNYKMPIRPGKARLWFSTQEEQDRYDDMMMASIELTQRESIEAPNFTFLYFKPKKEQFFEPNGKYEQAMRLLRAKRPAHQPSDKPLEPSLKYLRHLPALVWYSSIAGTYFLLRELPIRNFYARSFLMFIFLTSVMDRFKPQPGQFLTFTASLHFLEDENTL